MAVVSVDPSTGALVTGGAKLFPLCLSNGPPRDRNAPSGRNGMAEVAAAGINMIRTGSAAWGPETAPGLIDLERQVLDDAAAHGLLGWLWLGDLTDLPARTAPTVPSDRERLLVQVVNGLKGHPGLAAWKGVDEPRNPARGDAWIRPAGLVRGYERLKQLDARHPLVVIQAPGSSAAQLTPYRPALDVSGMDVYPVSYPPGIHGGAANKGVSVVGDWARVIGTAAGPKPFWITLQIAWTGVVRSQQRPAVVPRFPTLQQERFMALQAIVNGARGLVFFGGHLTQVCTPADAKAGWNWTFWERVLRPLVAELSSADVRPALVAPKAKATVKAGVSGVEVATRQEGRTLWVLAVRRDGGTSTVGFTGLPSKADGQKLTRGDVLSEWVQEPPPPPLTGDRQKLRTVAVEDRGFRDWFGPLDARDLPLPPLSGVKELQRSSRKRKIHMPRLGAPAA